MGLKAKGFELNFLMTYAVKIFYGPSFLVLYFSVFAKNTQFQEQLQSQC